MIILSTAQDKLTAVGLVDLRLSPAFSNSEKFLVFLTDLSITPLVNAEIEKRLNEPFPARSTIQVVGLPMGANVEVECLG